MKVTKAAVNPIQEVTHGAAGERPELGMLGSNERASFDQPLQQPRPSAMVAVVQGVADAARAAAVVDGHYRRNNGAAHDCEVQSPSSSRDGDRSRAIERKSRELAKPITAESGYSFMEICSQRRWPSLVTARFQLYVALWRAGYSLVEIGLGVGGRDHSTIMHGLRKALGDEAYDREFAERYPNIPFLRSRRPLAKAKPRIEHAFAQPLPVANDGGITR